MSTAKFSIITDGRHFYVRRELPPQLKRHWLFELLNPIYTPRVQYLGRFEYKPHLRWEHGMNELWTGFKSERLAQKAYEEWILQETLPEVCKLDEIVPLTLATGGNQ